MSAVMDSGFRNEFRKDLRQRRAFYNRIDDMLDYINELENEVQHWRDRYDILLEAKTEASNEEEANGSSNLDE